MSTITHSIVGQPQLRIARLVQLLLDQEQLAILEDLREHLPVTDPDRHALDLDADSRFAALATEHPEACSRDDGLTYQQAVLLAEIKTRPDRRWHTRKVRRFYRAMKQPCSRRTAAADLRVLCELGHLVAHGLSDERFYTLNTRKAIA